jgi:hypothetical protein
MNPNTVMGQGSVRVMAASAIGINTAAVRILARMSVIVLRVRHSTKLIGNGAAARGDFLG